MPVGVIVTKHDVNYNAGQISNALKQLLDDTVAMQSYLSGAGGAGLEGMGFTPQEAAILISAFNDLKNIATSFNDSAFIKQLYGLGIVFGNRP